MKNFVQNGDNYTFKADVEIKGGSLFVRAGVAGVAASDAAVGEPVVVCLQGVYELPKATGAGSALAAGTRAYATKDAPRVVTADATKGVALGHVMEDAPDKAATVLVRLCGG
jgi:predicted RecA/RadA family phage recombinase